MKISIVPKSTPGKWSVGLIIGLLLFFGVLWLLVMTGQQGGETFFSNLALSIPALLSALCGIAAFFTGIISLIKYRESSLLVLLAIIIGAFVLVFCLGEVLSPH